MKMKCMVIYFWGDFALDKCFVWAGNFMTPHGSGVILLGDGNVLGVAKACPHGYKHIDS